MARPRKKPEPQAAAEEPDGDTVKLKYSGPPGQAVRGLYAELEEGESYDVPKEIADSLVAGSTFWEKA